MGGIRKLTSRRDVYLALKSTFETELNKTWTCIALVRYEKYLATLMFGFSHTTYLT